MRNTLVGIADWIKEGGEWYCRPAESTGAIVYAGSLPEAAYIAQADNPTDAEEIAEVHRLLALTVEYARAMVEVKQARFVSEGVASLIEEMDWQYVEVPYLQSRGWVVAPAGAPNRWEIWLQSGPSAGGFVYMASDEIIVLMTVSKELPNAHP